MGTIFISHSSLDNDLAGEIVERLKQAGHTSVFLDFHPEDGIPAGRNWEQELYRRLRMCRAVIVLCTEHSMASKWCFAEIAHARALGKPVIPIKADECEIDELLKDRQILDLAVNAEEAFDRLLHALEVRGLDPEGSFDWDSSRPPYPGLLPFQESEAATFFGRDGVIRDGLAAMNRLRNLVGANLLLVLGASGSGKSSLVRAGLLPRLRRNPEQWIVVDPFRPLGDFIGEFAAALTSAFLKAGGSVDISSVQEKLRVAVGGGLTQAIQGVKELARDLRHSVKTQDARVVLVVDQAEELLASDVADGVGTKLFRALCESEAFVVVATLRSDFFGEFQGHTDLRGLEFETLPLGPMAAGDLRQVIARPAAMAGMELELPLIDALIEDAGRFDALPLLAFALRELWERRDVAGRITLNAYRDGLGGISGAIAQRAEETLQTASATDKQIETLRFALLQMVRINEEGEYARRVLRWEDVPQEAHGLLERFVTQRLLVSRGDGETSVIEVAHEALFKAWSRLAEWLAGNVELLRIRARVDLATQRWVAENKHKDFLLPPGRPLLEANSLLEARAIGLTDEGRAFIERSVVLRESEASQQQMERMKRQRRGKQLLFSLASLVIVACLGAYAFMQGRVAENAYDRAEVAREDAEVARGDAEFARARTETARIAYESLSIQSGSDTGSYEALSYALEAIVRDRSLGLQPPAVAHRALSKAVAAMYSRQPLVASSGEEVDSVLFSPDGQRLMTSFEGQGVLLDVENGRELFRLDSDYLVEGVGFSEDGLKILTVDYGTYIWDAVSGNLLHELEDPSFVIERAFFIDQDSKVLVIHTGSGFGVFDSLSGDLLSSFLPLEHEEGSSTEFLSQDGEQIVFETRTGYTTSSYEVRDIQLGILVTEMNAKKIQYANGNQYLNVNMVGCSIDGAYCAVEVETVAGVNQTSIVDMNSGKAFLAFSDMLFDAFSLNSKSALLGKQIYPGSVGRDEVRLPDEEYDLEDGPAFGGPLGDVGLLLMIAGPVMASLWDIDSGELLWEPEHAYEAWTKFLPQGELLVSSDSQFFVADIENDGLHYLDEFTGLNGELDCLGLAPDGSTAISQDYSNSSRYSLHRVGEYDNVPLPNGNGGKSILSPTGPMVIDSFAVGCVLAWHVETGEYLFASKYLGGEIKGVQFSPGGKYVAVILDSERICLLDASSGHVVFQFSGGFGEVSNFTFSQDEQRVLAIGIDGSSTVWDISSGDLLLSRPATVLEGDRFKASSDQLEKAWGVGFWSIWVEDHIGDKVDTTMEFFSLSLKEDTERRVAHPQSGILTLDRPESGWEDLYSWPASSKTMSFAFSRFSPDDRYIFSSLWDGTASIWDSTTGLDVLTLGIRGDSIVTQALFSPDGSFITIAYIDGMIKSWSTTTGDLLTSFSGHTEEVSEISFSADSSRLISASHDSSARIWDAHSGKQLVLLKHQAGVVRAVFSPNGLTVFTADMDEKCRIWDTLTGTELLSHDGMAGPIGSRVFSKDGNSALIGDFDTAFMWNTSPDTVLDWAWALCADESYLSEATRSWLEQNTKTPPVLQRKTWMGESPFHYVAMNGSLLAAKALFEDGHSISLHGEGQRQPLHVAAIYGQAEVASFLLEHGADFMAKGQDGKTPLDLAREHNHQSLIDLLESAQQSPK